MAENTDDAHWIAYLKRWSETGHTPSYLESQGLHDFAARIIAERDKARLDAGQLRLCLSCGLIVDAREFKPGDDHPECVDPSSGLAACTFDHTPQEAGRVWHDRIRAVEKEREALAAQLDAIERDGTEEHNAAVELRSEVAQLRMLLNGRVEDIASDILTNVIAIRRILEG